MNWLYLGRQMLLRGVSTGRKRLRFNGTTKALCSVCKPRFHAKPNLGELWNADETDNQQKMAF